MSHTKNSEHWFYEMSKIVDEANKNATIALQARNLRSKPAASKSDSVAPNKKPINPTHPEKATLQPEVIAALEKLLHSKKLQRGR